MELYLINKNNQTLNLLNNKNKFILKAAEALHGVETDIAELDSPYIDGAEIESVRALPRGIELTFKLRGNIKQSIDYFTSYVKSKQFVTLREKDGDRDIIIKGVATIPPYTRMVQSCEITLTIYCGQPYWEDAELIADALAKEMDLLNFPTEGQYFTVTGRPFGAIDLDMEKTFENNSDVAVGMIIKLLALGSVESPRITCSTGEQLGWYMELDLTLQPNDEIEISTVKGNKYILINGLETYKNEPILNNFNFQGYDWLQLEQGSNTFNITSLKNGERVPAENVYFTINYKGRYE